MKVAKTALIILLFIEIDVICGGKIQVSNCKEDKRDPCIGRCNNGTCIPLENGGYKCECPVGIGGYKCDKNPCNGACMNHIKCTPLTGNDFKCDCLPGFFGKSCEIELTCDFEKNNTCGWIQDTQDEVDWILKSGRTPSSGTGPFGDHTLGNESGIYLYTEASRIPARSNARLITPVITAKKSIQHLCLSFYYHMRDHLTGMGSLNVFLKGKHDLTTIWSMTGKQGDEWLKADVPITLKRRMEYQIIFEAVTGEHFTSDIAIDDIIFKKEATPCSHFPPEAKQPVPPPPLLEVGGIQGCQFENPQICHWTQDTKTQGWQYKVGPIATGDTGPSNDHTFDNTSGHYLFIDGSVFVVQAVYRLFSPVVTTRKTQCIEFYYHMDICSSGTLSVFQTTGNNTDGLVPRFTISGDQGNQWLKGTATFTGPQDYRVVFEATTFPISDPYCDIAIDDITAVKC